MNLNVFEFSKSYFEGEAYNDFAVRSNSRSDVVTQYVSLSEFILLTFLIRKHRTKFYLNIQISKDLLQNVS